MPKKMKQRRKRFSDTEVLDIRQRAARGELDHDIAHHHNTVSSTVGAIRSGNRYTKVAGPLTIKSHGGQKKPSQNGSLSKTIPGIAKKLETLKASWYEIKAAVQILQARIDDIEGLINA